MLIVFTRSIIVYIFLLAVIRIMGKKQLGELQPYEFVITLIIADLAAIPMTDTTVPISYGLIPIFTLLILHILLNKVNKNSMVLRRVINGKPIIIIDGDGINLKAINALDMTVSDVMEALRIAGYFNLSEIRFAIVETNGTVTVVPKSQFKPAALGDMNIAKQEPELPFSVICEGVVMHENLEKSGLSEQKLNEILKRHNLRIKDVLILTVTGGEEIYLQAKHKKAVQATLAAA